MTCPPPPPVCSCVECATRPVVMERIPCGNPLTRFNRTLYELRSSRGRGSRRTSWVLGRKGGEMFQLGNENGDIQSHYLPTPFNLL